MEEASLTRRKSMLPAAVPEKIKRRQEFLEYFRDPTNATALLANGLKGESEAAVSPRDSFEESSGGQVQRHGQDGGGIKDTRFSMLRHRKHGENQAYVLVAVQFINRQFEGLLGKTQEDQRLLALSQVKFFEYLAKKLKDEEPVLKRVSGQALRSMFERLIKKYGALQTFKQSEPDEIFLSTSTILMDKVGLMYRLHQYLANPEKEMGCSQELIDPKKEESETEELEIRIDHKYNMEEPLLSSALQTTTTPAVASTLLPEASTATTSGIPVQGTSQLDDILEEALSQLSEYRKSIVQSLQACIADSTRLHREQNDSQQKLSHRVDLIEEATEINRSSLTQATERQWNALVEQSRQLMVVSRSMQSMSFQVHLQGEAINNIQASVQEILRRLQ